MVTPSTPDEKPATPDPTDAPGEATRSEVRAEPSAEPPTFPIVGIGASAGGLAAFEAFFSGIPPDVATGMAFVLVQHLAPDHKSLLTELVGRYTRMRVQEIEDGMPVSPDCVYIIPPNQDLALFGGRLHLLESSAPRGLRLPIDSFFRSLARDRHERAIGVILSGTGSDGTLGARAIKGEGGLVMVQEPRTAAYDGMPRSVIAAGLADFMLPPVDMPARLMAYASHAFVKVPQVFASSPKTEDALAKICLLLRDKTSHDFSQYKQSTLVRRIERRMALHQLEHRDEYARYLQQDPEEIESLFHDLLIGVTSFFRDPEAFAVLEQEVIPRLFAGKPAGAAVRVWVCGCSTGEEAYSIAMLLQEHLEQLKQTFKVQVFATDVDARAIERARAGVYPASIAADLSPERLARFFTEEPNEGVYRIRKTTRDLLIFSEQDLIRDPPFSRLDLISCRNLLIYLDGDLQKRLIPLFYYSLNPYGTLFLGNSESIGEFLTLFAPISRKWKLYIRQDRLPGALTTASPALGSFLPSLQTSLRPPIQAPLEPGRSKPDLRALTEAALLRHYEPAGVLINGRGEILHIYGRTGQYLEPADGDAAMNIFNMAREGLRRPLTNALHRAVARQETVHLPDLRVKTNGDFSGVNLTVRPESFLGPDVTSDLYLVVLEAIPKAVAAAVDAEGTDSASPTGDDRRIADLELELRAKEEYLQTTLEEMETANEELKSTNEEMQSVNEELQSTNEELETSKEELQSVNEELATVNAELQSKVVDLSRANNDMNNLLSGTGVATIFVDHQSRITRFTPAATQLIKLIQSDLGRPVGDIVSNLFDYHSLVEDVTEVLRTLIPLEKEVRTLQDALYLLRIGPYRTLNNVIEGAVITFVDISSRRRMEEELRVARVLAEGVVDAMRDPLLVLDADLRVISANRAYGRCFRTIQAEVLGRCLYDLGNGQWDTPALRRLLRDLQSQGTGFDDYRMPLDLPGVGSCTMRLNARGLDPVAGKIEVILFAIEGVSEDPSAPIENAAPEPSG
ncbi:chemotaxis protein CheB [Thiocystis violacea]|uniref:chemotaxis protein CheB n=1 Tax=Thiocystis violacea TaxID=13725 RepID=UPI0019035068|nr:chemotaxis protein CheB [Thiocystis violacea]MBK1719452.1 chemotaxis protein CheR [Thiocystis violacea]